MTMPSTSKQVESSTETESLLINQDDADAENQEHNSSKRKRGGPDGWRAWTVALANFFINFVVVGLGRMSGIFFKEFMSFFHIDRQAASMPFSLQQAARNFFGPVAGILGQKYGVRNVTIAGGIIGTVSAVACYFALEINWITLLWGIAFGICTALTTTLNQVPIDQYFEKYRTTAGGFAFSGGCVSAFIFPTVLEPLISNCGLNNTFLFMGLLIFLVIPLSLIMVKPPWLDDSENVTEQLERNDNPASYSTFIPKTLTKVGAREETSIDFEFLKQNREFVFQLLYLTVSNEEASSGPFSDTLWDFSDTLLLIKELEQLYTVSLPNNSSEITKRTLSSSVANEITHIVSDSQINTNDISKQNSTMNIVDYSDKIKSSDSVSNIQCSATNQRLNYLSSKLHQLYQLRKDDALRYFPSHLQLNIIKIIKMLRTLNNLRVFKEKSRLSNNSNVINGEPSINNSFTAHRHHEDASQSRNQSNSFMVHIKTAIKLHTNPLFLLICVCRGVFMLTFIPLLTIIIDFAMDKGLQENNGKYIISILSLGDLVGRLGLGWINDIGCLSLPKYMLVAMLMLAISISTMPLIHSELGLMAAVLIFGILQGSLFIRHQVLISKYMSRNEQSIGMGFINFLSGFIGFALPFYIGYFRDKLGSYDDMFYINGAICAAIGMLWSFEPYFIKVSRKSTYEEIPNDAYNET